MNNNRIILLAGNEKDYLTRNDTIRDCRQKVTINESSTLELQLEKSDRKWAYFSKPDMTAEVNGRVYCVWGEDSVKASRDMSGTHLPVVLKELWYKLGRKYITAYNINIATSAEFDHIDQHMVVLLGNSPDPLYINGSRVSNPYTVGTAPYMFWCMLYGTGWSLDTRYADYWPDGVFDLETDKQSVLENVQLLQSFYGGMLFWDSKNMRMALVDETKYQPYEGFQVRYAKNLVSIERRDNHDIITRLYPYGNSYLNIAAVNSNREYIDNFTHTTEIREGILTHNDIYTQSSLLTWGKRQSELYGKPRYAYSVDLFRYREEVGRAIPQPELGKLGKVIDPDVVPGGTTKRILSMDQNVFVDYDCSIIIGDIISTFEGKFKDIEDDAGKAGGAISGTGQIPGAIVKGSTPALDKANVYWASVIEDTENQLRTAITQTAAQIRLEAQDMKNGLEASISLTASQIRLEVKDVQNGLQSSINMTASEIRLEVSNVKAGLESSITLTASQIRSEVKDIQSGLQSSITQTARDIRAEVSAVDGRVSSVKITADAVTTEVKNARGSSSTLKVALDSITSRVTSVEGYSSTITQTADRVAVVVDSSKNVRASIIVEAINNSSVTINANRINLTGYVTVSGLGNTGTTEIDGGRIKSGYISAARISSQNSYLSTLYATNITATNVNVKSRLNINDASTELVIRLSQARTNLVAGSAYVTTQKIVGTNGSFTALCI